jgi:ferredoxin-thioredoxin reductase catalytic subunit
MDYVIPSIDVDKVLTELKSAAARAANEEEFKINAERILYSEVLESLVFSLEGMNTPLSPAEE